MHVQKLLPTIAFLAIGYTLGSILLATAVSPSFSWRENALSNLGVTTTDAGTTTTVMLFNGGLVGGGLVGVLFCLLAVRLARRPGVRPVVVVLGLTMVMMALVGVFPQGTTPHFPIAAAFFLLVTATLWTDAWMAFLTGHRRWSWFSFATGSTNLLVWILWFVAAPIPEALAIPEIVSAVVFGCWLIVYAFHLTRLEPIVLAGLS